MHAGAKTIVIANGIQLSKALQFPHMENMDHKQIIMQFTFINFFDPSADPDMKSEKITISGMINIGDAVAAPSSDTANIDTAKP